MSYAEWVSDPFGALPDGRMVNRFTATLESGVAVSVTEFGASLLSFRCPDRNGQFADIVLACADARGQWTQTNKLGAAIGRVAGRIGGAGFQLDGTYHTLSTNEGANHLHGGVEGFGRRLWQAETISGAEPAIRFAILSADGDEGYPGNLQARLTYRLESPARLSLHFEAECDKPTPFNPTSHGYFNLDGHDAGPVDGHLLALRSHWFTPLGIGKIPQGGIIPVEGGPFDFTRMIPVGQNRVWLPDGYDHNFVIDHDSGVLREAAHLCSPASGRHMRVSTDRPCIHLYTAGTLKPIAGKNRAIYGPFSGLCLETQGYPDAPNQPDFPKEWLRPGQIFSSTTIFDVTADEHGRS